ncbi:ATP phosphoribosyltransferase [Ferrimicrobium acidiphilum]|uniref:ATP phosphoribosyltransferase n=1 Tax=Ferrimicrobium acidiphilum TaxID=121039 RepID=UPI0023EFE354|nr:ATP phosphoribosyltransferase [Ferrimicrobium acidiphilum]MCL5053720.1 ATP phosphoribosyltransferase [Gammaproteobacteria bacterium]
MLRIVVPKGSLEKATFALFAEADLPIERSSEVDYRASIDDPRVREVRVLRPQEIATYVAEGLFDLGITGRDWINETQAEVVSLGELRYSKATSRPIRVVLAVGADSEVHSVADLHDGVRVATEYPELARRFFREHGIEPVILLSYGATEAKIPEIADAVVEITETGRALRAAGLRIIETVLVSYTELIANPTSAADPEKRHAMEQLQTLLLGALSARDRVLVKLNVPSEHLSGIIEALPAMKAPTVSQLYQESGFAVEAVVPRSTINLLIPMLKDRGATDILELPLSKVVP